MRHFALLLLVVAVPALAKGTDTAKIFKDKGSTYFRTDNKKALAVGAELDAVADPAAKPAGKAIIMEVQGSLARITLDDEATAGGAKYVVLPSSMVAKAPTAAKGDDDDDDQPKAPPPRTPGPKLDGKVDIAGLHFSWRNDSDSSWTQCKLVHSDGSFYDVGEVVKHTDDGVLRVKLGGAPQPVYDHVQVVCAEGKSRFFFDKPSQPKGTLKGYATNDSGSIILYNQNETAWTACDVRKPDGSHYVLGTLKGHADDSINKGRFKKEDEPNKPKWIELRCKEGELHKDL